MVSTINSLSAGKDSDAFKEGAYQFIKKHQNLGWHIAAGQFYGRLHITVTTPDNRMLPVPVPATSDIAGGVFKALERALDRKQPILH